MSAVVQSITSRDNELVQRVRRLLSRPGGYRAAGQVWLEGDHLCQAWLDQGRAALHAVIEQSAWDSRPDLRDLALRAARVAVVPLGLMKVMSGLETPGPLGMLVALRPSEAESNAESTAPDPVEPGVAVGIPTVVLDRLQDPGNAGSILRSAAALGIDKSWRSRGRLRFGRPRSCVQPWARTSVCTSSRGWMCRHWHRLQANWWSLILMRPRCFMRWYCPMRSPGCSATRGRALPPP